MGSGEGGPVFETESLGRHARSGRRNGCRPFGTNTVGIKICNENRTGNGWRKSTK